MLLFSSPAIKSVSLYYSIYLRVSNNSSGIIRMLKKLALLEMKGICNYLMRKGT